MGDFEKGQKRLRDLWDDCMSDEDSNVSEFGDVYLSDEYKPSESEEESSEEDSSEDDTMEEVIPKRAKLHHTVSYNSIDPNQAGTSNVTDATIGAETPNSNTFAKAEGNSEAESRDQPDNVIWSPIDGSSLKQFHFTHNSVGFNPEIYELFIEKQPYDFFKIFVTDEIIEYMVSQTSIYAEQVLKV